MDGGKLKLPLELLIDSDDDTGTADTVTSPTKRVQLAIRDRLAISVNTDVPSHPGCGFREGTGTLPDGERVGGGVSSMVVSSPHTLCESEV